MLGTQSLFPFDSDVCTYFYGLIHVRCTKPSSLRRNSPYNTGHVQPAPSRNCASFQLKTSGAEFMECLPCPQAESDEFLWRIGPLNVYNPKKPDRTYDLDLAHRDDREVCKVSATRE